MQAQRFIFLSLISLLTSCGCGNERELAFDTKIRQLINTYPVGDTIYFSNQSGMKDTIVVAEIKDWTNNCMYHGSTVNIKHLPQNLWIDGHEGTDRGLVPLDQSLIEVGKELYEPGNYIGIKYRNFRGQLTDSTEVRSDTLFKYCNQSRYMVVKDENSDYKDYKNDSLHVMKIFWTQQYGLTGYELRNGEIYRIEK